MQQLNIGLFGIGLDTYWEQFDCLKQRLEGYLQTVEKMLQQPGSKVINAGLVDNYDSAIAAAQHLKQNDISILFLYATTYALSSTVLPVVQKCKVPVVILNLSPEEAIDYAAFNQLTDRTKMTGEWLAYCGACPVPELPMYCNAAIFRFFK
jgi:L-arabinose isomerase